MRNSTWNRRRALALPLLAAGLALSLAACGDDDEDDAATDEGTEEGAPEEEGEEGGAADGLVIEGFTFPEHSVAAGDTVSVTNEDGAPHTVTSDDDAWDEVEIGGGGTGEFAAPSEAGEYAYHCEIHTTMTGTLVVE